VSDEDLQQIRALLGEQKVEIKAEVVEALREQKAEIKAEVVEALREQKAEIKTEVVEALREQKSEILEVVRQQKAETLEAMRDMQTEILRGLERFSRGNFSRLHRLDVSDQDLNDRINALEERVLALETRPGPLGSPQP